MLTKSLLQIGSLALLLCSCDAPDETARVPSDLDSCFRNAIAAGLTLKTEFQTNLRNFIVDAKPDFIELADLNMNLQTALAEARAIHSEFLLSYDRARIDSVSGISTLRNFDWADADEMALLSAEPDHEELKQRIENLKIRNNGHPDWPRLRETVNTQFAEQTQYQSLMEGFFQRQTEIEAEFDSCRVNWGMPSKLP